MVEGVMKFALLFCLIMTPFIRGGAAEIEVVKEGSVRSDISLEGFKTDGSKECRTVRSTLASDLERSGWFRVAGRGKSVIQVSGTCRASGDSLAARCEVKGPAKHFLSESFRGPLSEPGELAHEIADRIVEAVKGVPGIASTRIAMVGVRGGRKDLYICDADGSEFVQLTREGAVCIAPSWTPDGRSVAYTSFHGGFPDIYVINLHSRKRKKLLSYPGLNLGASISPDGRLLAATLSKDGNPELYVMTMSSGRLRRLTRTPDTVETSPSWSPDGKQIAYVSDASGLPQIYVVGLGGGRSRRLVYRGSQNVAPDWGPRGKIAYSSRRNGHYQICVYDPGEKNGIQVTSGNADFENPSWAPDGRHIVCTRTQGYKSNVYVLDIMGGAPVRLTKFEGDWHSPTWSPE